MGFYKKDIDSILTGTTTVCTPTVTLVDVDKDSYTYPQDGWYWFDTFDEALVFFAGLKNSDSITMRQARLYLLSKGLLGMVDSIVSQNEAWKIEWEYASEVQRTNQLIPVLQESLALTDEQVDTMFIEASKL